MLANFASYLLYFGVDVAMLLVAGFIYVKVTPYDEIQLIREGNTAAALGLGGTALGYSIVIYTVTTISTSILPLIVWSLISLAVQVAAFELLQYVVIRDDWKRQMESGELAHGLMLCFISISFGIINAACLHP